MDMHGAGLLSLLIAISVASLHELEYNAALAALPSKYYPRFRRCSKLRHRVRFGITTMHLSDEEFRHSFRLSPCSFNKLLMLLLPHLRRDEDQARRSSAGAITPAVRLAITLRVLAGGLHHDQMLSWQVGRSTVYALFKDTILAINNALHMPGVPLENETELKKLAAGFASSPAAPNPLPGCIAAIDGIAISISKPRDSYVPRNFYCRKGFYALPVQAVVDSKYRFLYMSCLCTGSTHDSVAFEVSQLADQLRNTGLMPGYWIAGDPAYVCAHGLLTPWSKSKLTGERGLFCDSFNFYHSSHRIHVEQAFGILVRRWALFWRPVDFNLVGTLRILSAAMLLHNFAIEEDGHRGCNFCRDPHDAELQNAAFSVWWQQATALRHNISEQAGVRRDLEYCELREKLTVIYKIRT